jgi:hypothetical protein
MRSDKTRRKIRPTRLLDGATGRHGRAGRSGTRRNDRATRSPAQPSETHPQRVARLLPKQNAGPIMRRRWRFYAAPRAGTVERGSCRETSLPGRDGLEAMAARRQLGFVVTYVCKQQRVLQCHGTRLFQEFDKLLDAERFLIGRARAASSRETIGRRHRLNRSHGLGAGSRKGGKNDCGRDRKSGEEAGASRDHGGLLILVRNLLISRVGPLEGSVTLTNTLPTPNSGRPRKWQN